ncbi:YTX2 protein, partial [Polypterus senegalus]|nr:YTX2 protein [Polypterus senegalus]
MAKPPVKSTPQSLWWSLCFIVCSSIYSVTMASVHIGTLNINGGRSPDKRVALFDFIRQKDLNVTFLQETHIDEQNQWEWSRDWKGDILFSNGTNVSAGVAILFLGGLQVEVCSTDELVKGRLLKVTVKLQGSVVTFINVYAPNEGEERLHFFNKLGDLLSKCDPEEVVVLGGDFNCTLDTRIDRNNGLEPHPRSARALGKIIKDIGLEDVWRAKNGACRQYTWGRTSGNTISMARLDHFYSFKHLLGLFKVCSIVPTGFSDHSLVCCTLICNTYRPRSPYWHFNTLLLKDQNFKELFVHFWGGWKDMKKEFTSLQQWWEVGKSHIRALCQEYTRNVTQVLRSEMAALEIKIAEFQQLLEKGPNEQLQASLTSAKLGLAHLLETRAQGALVRARFQRLTEMDAPTQYFFGLEKKNSQSKILHCIRTPDGSETQEPSEIRQVVREFYELLFAADGDGGSEDQQAFLQDLPQLPNADVAQLNREVTFAELTTALGQLKTGKVPGIDGIPVEFYKEFWDVIGLDLLEVFRWSFKTGLLPQSCRRAVITLLPKKGDLCLIKNWRPVSLLCADYKVLSKALANRMVQVLGRVVHPDQNYCVAGRSIFNNIFLIRDILAAAELFGFQTGLIFLDQEKAFDRVSHSFLWNAMKAFGFGGSFIKYIRLLYSDISGIIKVNGGLCAPFSVRRGVRQGCSLSGMLYALALEPFLVHLRKVLTGLSIPNCNMDPVKVTAYADDLAVVITSQKDLGELTEGLWNYSKASSAKVNWNKSSAVLVGNWTGCSPPRLEGGLQWTTGGFLYLGVHLGDDHYIQKNWEGLLDKVTARLAKWKWILPQLSYRGRMLVINNLVTSSLWHKCICLQPPLLLVQQIQKAIIDFFWTGTHWIQKGVLFLPLDEGGQGLIDITSRIAAFRLQTIQKLLYPVEQSQWMNLAVLFFKQARHMGLGKSLLLCHLDKIKTLQVPEFYKSLLAAWQLLAIKKDCDDLSTFWVLHEPLFYNPAVGTATGISENFINHFIIHGITTIKDIIDWENYTWKSAQVVAVETGVHSVRLMEKFLWQVQSSMDRESMTLLHGIFLSQLKPIDETPFPTLTVSPAVELRDGETNVLALSSLEALSLPTVPGKQLYRICVKVNNLEQLRTRRHDTPWRDKLGAPQGLNPAWRSLYKPPLASRVGDLQWRLVHGILAVNSFLSIICPGVSDCCPFCGLRESVFHAFMYCERLQTFFSKIERIVEGLGVPYNGTVFVFGVKITKHTRENMNLINFIIGQAKLSIWKTRKNKITGRGNENVVVFFRKVCESRILVDFNFYKSTNNLAKFKEMWCVNNVLCVCDEDNLQFVL